MKSDWLDELKKRLAEESALDSGVGFDRMVAIGIINERGEVTGHLHRWDADLAITQVKRAAGNPRIDAFRCLKPVFGMPGKATKDISRDSLVGYLKEGKKIITAYRDDRLDMWKMGHHVHLSPNGFVVCESANDDEDNVGDLPEFHPTNSLL